MLEATAAELTPLAPSASRYERTVANMLGDLPTFFREHFRKTPLYVPGAAADFVGQYNVEDFLADVEAT